MTYTNTCLIYQQDKVEKTKVWGLLECLPIPMRYWKSVSLDFITHLPKLEEHEAILVIIDRFSKYITFVPTSKQCSTELMAQFFFRYVVKLWGIPRSIVSDRDSQFIETFQAEFFQFLRKTVNRSSSYHPQKNWVQLLDVAQFYFNCETNLLWGRFHSRL